MKDEVNASSFFYSGVAGNGSSKHETRQWAGDYHYSPAKFYYNGTDNPIAIGFEMLTHFSEN